MAEPSPSEGSSPSGSPIFTNSHDTALCLVPPQHLWPSIDALRSRYDKAHGRWPPHVNLVYPFVRPENLDTAIERIGAVFAKRAPGMLPICLDSSSVFIHSRTNSNTKYLHDSDSDRVKVVSNLRAQVLASLGQTSANGDFTPHLTVGQSSENGSDEDLFLRHKVSFMPNVEWEARQLCVLIRDRPSNGDGPGGMKLWGAVDLVDGAFQSFEKPSGFYGTLRPKDSEEGEEVLLETSSQKSAYAFDSVTSQWKSHTPHVLSSPPRAPNAISVASYNVLAEFTWPPSEARFPLLAENIGSCRADAIVLQEVTDDFLSYLMSLPAIRSTYPYSSHGPPAQSNIEPLPSLLNLVILSKHAFDWTWVPFSRQHKGAVVAKFSDLGIHTENEFKPLILATVHLTCGLTDGSIAAKKAEIQRAIDYTTSSYPGHPVVLAGDFNLATSARSIDAALKRGGISTHSAECLAGIEKTIGEAGMVDAWVVSRELREDDEDEDDACEGEQGATFDPSVNALAAQIVGSGLNNRPQRYDRILVRGAGHLHVSEFSLFGQKPLSGTGGFASDHWGVKCLLRVDAPTAKVQKPEIHEEPEAPIAQEISKLVVPVELKQAPRLLSNVEDIRTVLTAQGAIPSSAEAEQRRTALNTLRSVLLGDGPGSDKATAESSSALTSLLRSSLVTVPVGSYGLGVWSSHSDIDLLCIGPLSSSTFFALAAQRLRRASVSNPAIRLLRRVRARAGTMLELSVNDVRMDLQYCPAAGIAANWPSALRLPPTDPVFSLPVTTLARLKAARDADYIRRSAPDPEAFRLAHRAIVTWARARGIYAARFGLLGGIQISLLLLRVCKLLARPDFAGPDAQVEDISKPSLRRELTVPDILTSFFSHYANFDFARSAAFDPFFHRRRLGYTRSSREPLAILGYYPPALNTAHAASAPSVRTIVEEFKNADKALHRDQCQDGVGMSWERFLTGDTTNWGSATADFLMRYKSYIRIDLNYWGLSLARGSAFVGWVESRCVLLLVDLHRRAPGVHARIWPARFVPVDDGSKEKVAAEGMDYQGCYLIGLDRVEGQEEQDLKISAGAIQTALGRFEELIRSDEKHFDVASQWLSASIVKRAELGKLKLDTREWGSYNAGDDESDLDDEEEEDLEEEDFDENDSESFPKKAKKVKKTKRSVGKHNHPSTPSPSSSPPRSYEKKSRLRTAQDVLARLRWDPTLGGTVSSDAEGGFIVGYEDRFTGTKERALEEWKSESTHEEFIPMHRVLYFRRRVGDGGVVWDRRTRKDEVFGSGG